MPLLKRAALGVAAGVLGLVIFALALAGVMQVARAGTPDPFTPREVHLVALRDKGHPALSKDGRQLWALTVPLTYRTHAGDTITAPAGMVTDLASIPRMVSPVLAPDGPYVEAAVIHDFLYRSSGTCTWKKHPTSCSRKAPYARNEADDILDQAMADIGVTAWQRWLVWSGVRAGGASGWSH